LWRPSFTFRLGSFAKDCIQPLVNRISIKTLERYWLTYFLNLSENQDFFHVFSGDFENWLFLHCSKVKTVSMDEESICFLCDEEPSAEEAVTETRGLDTIRKSSVQRGDRIAEWLTGLLSINVHTICRKNYTRKSSSMSVPHPSSGDSKGVGLGGPWPPRFLTAPLLGPPVCT